MKRRDLLKSALLAIPGVGWLANGAEARKPKSRNDVWKIINETMLRQRQIPVWHVRARQYLGNKPLCAELGFRGLILEIESGGICWIRVPDDLDELPSPELFSDIALVWEKDKSSYDWHLLPSARK